MLLKIVCICWIIQIFRKYDLVLDNHTKHSVFGSDGAPRRAVAVPGGHGPGDQVRELGQAGELRERGIQVQGQEPEELELGVHALK